MKRESEEERMAKEKYTLRPGEKLLLKESNVLHGFWAAYTDELVLTTQRIIHIKRGMLNNFKELVEYPLDEVNQVIIGKAFNGTKQLEVYHQGRMENFAFQSERERSLEVWSMAISDRYSENAHIFDFNYYQSLSDENIENMLFNPQFSKDKSSGNGIDARFLGEVAKNVVKSGNLTVGGVMKGAAKASGKQVKNSMFSELKDELGLNELQDEFTEVGNEFREAFGLKRKKTHAEIKNEQMNDVFNRQKAAARQAALARKEISPVQKVKIAHTSGIEVASLEKQIEMLKKLKELVDAGILTQEEFDAKKKVILNS